MAERFFGVQTTQCAVPKESKLARETTLTQSRIVSITIFELFSPFCEIRHNKQNLQRQNLESLYAQNFLAKIICNKCNCKIRSLILILTQNSMKRQRGKKGKQAFRYDKKNIQNSTCCPGKAKCLEYNSALLDAVLYQISASFFYKHFKKAIVNEESLS